MDLYRIVYKTAYYSFHPFLRQLRLNRSMVRGLGRKRPNRVGRALVSYISEFVRYISDQSSYRVWDQDDLESILENAIPGKYVQHSHYWESAEMVRQLIERGFVVDCIYDRNGYLVEDVSGYDLILDEWTNLPRWANHNQDAKKLFYTVTCHWLHWNAAELQRLAWLFNRRGIELPPKRQLPPLLGLNDADLVSYVGSDFILGTYGAFGSKMRRIQVSATATTSGLKSKNWSVARKRFLFFGSTGWVHRGLDLVLEAFMKTGLELLICGADDGFIKVYGEELKSRPNIQYLGFVYPTSDTFQHLADTTCAVVYPSAAEGCSTSILQCMHFGLIPLVTEATGLGIHAEWPPLRGETDQELIADIVRRCAEVSELPDQQLAELSHFFWQYANQNHSRQAYRESLGLVLDELLG